MTVRKLGIIMYGVTGRMGLNQHLVRSIVAIREQGGVALPNGDRIMPDPIWLAATPRRWRRWHASTKSIGRRLISMPQ